MFHLFLSFHLFQSYEETAVETSLSLDLSTDGAFFAPFWGIFDMWYSPTDLRELKHASAFTPFFVWLYLLVSLVLFVNLLVC